MPSSGAEQDEVRELMKRTGVALKEGGVPFALCGGYAAWVRGAPEPEHDADFMVPEVDVASAREVLTSAGLQVRDPAEDWLFKVVDDDVFVDVLWRSSGRPVDRALVQRAEVLPVFSVHMPVLAATDILVTKLDALDEHYCDFARLLPVARALREQVHWPEVARKVAGNDFAVVFLQLLDRLGITPAPEPAPLRSPVPVPPRDPALRADD